MITKETYKLKNLVGEINWKRKSKVLVVQSKMMPWRARESVKLVKTGLVSANEFCISGIS